MSTSYIGSTHWMDDPYKITPMRQETSDFLLQMIDCIGIAYMPDTARRQIFREQAERYIYGDLDTIEKAYDSATTLLIGSLE